MSAQELLTAINHLSPAERLTLLEALARSVKSYSNRSPCP